jgi:hypothetical protein
MKPVTNMQVRKGAFRMGLSKGLTAIAAALMLVSCGGGGADAGTQPFGEGSGTGGGGTEGGGTGGGGTSDPTVPTTPGGGISDVATGIGSQRFMSISSPKYNLNWALDGDTTTIQIFAADTAGNPVPNGTVVQFSTEGGQIATSCQTTGVQSGEAVISGCSVTFNTQDFRPLDGLVTIIAWMEGEEAYKDSNGNGRYDAGEPFIDSGQIFRDDDSDGVFNPSFDELVVSATLSGTPGLGTSACAPAPVEVNINEIPRSVDPTCDGVWGRTLIRRTIVLPVSDPRLMNIEAVGSTGVTVYTNFGTNNVAAPAGTTVTVLNPPADCTVTLSPPTVGTAAVGPTFHAVLGTGSATNPAACSGKTVSVEAKFLEFAPARTSFTFP